ncbi:hypothetical protein CsSME_00021032 [Camellia sinensis var. sinensis]
MQTLALRTIFMKRKRQERRRRRSENEKTHIRAISQLNLPNLPEEILIEMLSRLPLKSLLQFNLVSKQWHSLIQSSSVKSVVPKHKVFVCGMFSSLYSIDEDCCVKNQKKTHLMVMLKFLVRVMGCCLFGFTMICSYGIRSPGVRRKSWDTRTCMMMATILLLGFALIP